MLFYEFKVSLSSSIMPASNQPTFRQVVKDRVISKAETANSMLPSDVKFYICNFRDRYLTLAGAIGIKARENPTDLAGRFIKTVGYESDTIKGGEITVKEFAELIYDAEGSGFVEDDNAVLEKLGLESYSSCIRNKFDEFLADERSSREKINAFTKTSVFCESLSAEIDRVFEGEKKPFSAHPVHYIIYSDDKEETISTIKCLTSALFTRGRLRGRRVNFIEARAQKDLLDGDIPPTLAMDSVKFIYNSISGGTVVLSPGNLCLAGSAAYMGMTTVDELADQIRDHRHDCLTILVFSKKETDAALSLKRSLPGIRFIEIKETLISRDNAIDLLVKRAESIGIENTESLTSMIDADCSGYYIEELDDIFDKWIDSRLCNDVYPQYSDMACTIPGKKYTKGDAYEKLKMLIGLGRAKSIIERALNFNSFQKLFKDKGHADLRMSRHMVFTGNPGTAKTTVARLFAQIMKDNGVLPVGKLIEVGRSDLVGKYVGWTAAQVANVFEQARGSVLFIDEAYSLCDSKGSYGEEAINTIVQLMENRRDDTIVIFAGYPDKMQEFLDTNPGLRSRIAFHVNFDDYSTEELFEILEFQAKENNMNLAPDVKQKFMGIVGRAKDSKDFGNGRFVRNAFENAVMSQANRVMSSITEETISDEDLTTLKACDFSMPEVLDFRSNHRTIGFAS